MTAFVLVPGAGLGSWAWREVARELRGAGHDVYPVTLTGLAERAHLGGPCTGLETRIADITAVVEAEERPAGRVAHVACVDSRPVPDGTAFAEFLPPQDRERTGVIVVDDRQLPPQPFDPAVDPVMRERWARERCAGGRLRRSGCGRRRRSARGCGRECWP